jgi:hypothetical protein
MACANPGAERTAMSQAVETFAPAFNNLDIQQCKDELLEAGRDRGDLF